MRLRRVLATAVMFVVLGAVGFGESKKNVIYSGRYDWSVTQTIPCATTIDFRVIYRERITEWDDGSGGYHYSWNYNSTLLRGVDAEGNEYSGSETWHYGWHVASNEEFPLQETTTWNFRLESRGGGPNVIAKWRLRLTINAPGQVTVSRELDSLECVPK